MTTPFDGGLADHSVQTCKTTEEYRKDSLEGEHGSSRKPDSDQIPNWSKAKFVHQARVLARRLAAWHIDDNGPVWAPNGIDFLQELERPFRYRVLQGQHVPKMQFSPPNRLVPLETLDKSEENIAGNAIALHPGEYRKDETIWMFRDFYEHLTQLGNSDVEELLQLKVDQLLDIRMYQRAHSECFGDYIAGNRVPQSLLDELIDAAKLYFEKSLELGNCITCGRVLALSEFGRSECDNCQSQEGKLLDLYVAIHATGDSPDRIREWPMIRAYLRNAFGADKTFAELWELMTDRLRVKGWDSEQWLRTKYEDFLELLKSGLLNERLNPAEHVDLKSSNNRLLRSKPVVEESGRDRRSIEEIERNTPVLDTQSIEWIAARKENQEKLGYPTTTLATYRLTSSGGRQLSAYFGIDKDGRRWRRQADKTPTSMIFYFASDIRKYQSKVSN